MNRLEYIEQELKKRWKYPYQWGQKQNDAWDRLTNFIYRTQSFDELLRRIEAGYPALPRRISPTDYFNYALNRWYNFHSARAIEEIFCTQPGVVPHKNQKSKLIDFILKGITFDHKSTVFPDGFPGSLAEARKNPESLIIWLYRHQSQEGRKHWKNRLFIVFYSSQGDHWKLKAEIGWIKTRIEDYTTHFREDHLLKFQMTDGSTVLSDIIWGVK